MSATMHTRDGLLWVAEVSPTPAGGARVTIVEMVGERGYLERRMSAARALARRAVNMTGRTQADPVHFCGGQGRVTVEVFPNYTEEVSHA